MLQASKQRLNKIQKSGVNSFAVLQTSDEAPFCQWPNTVKSTLFGTFASNACLAIRSSRYCMHCLASYACVHSLQKCLLRISFHNKGPKCCSASKSVLL